MEPDAMFTEQINLNVECLECGNKTYQEHESGAYVCVNCGFLSKILHNQEVDFNDKNNFKSFYKRGGRNRGFDDEHMEDNETRLNTVLNTTKNTLSNSEYNGMSTPRLSYLDSEGEEVQIRSTFQTLADSQKIFLKILINVCRYLEILDSKRGRESEMNMKLLKEKEIMLAAKSIWVFRQKEKSLQSAKLKETNKDKNP